ncbi:MAG: CHAP domain-containing protein [Armatimonadetes bacterium]|nr:CHAP domain-containing protein [Armatimonadota bacterium]
MGRGHWIDKWVMALVIGFTVLHLGSVTASAAQQEEKAVGTLAGPYEALDGLAQFQKDTGQKDVRADNSADTQYKGGPGQCVWFVKAVRTELAGKIFPAGRYGLAWEWYEFFTNTLRWHGGKTPKAGAVMDFVVCDTDTDGYSCR